MKFICICFWFLFGGQSTIKTDKFCRFEARKWCTDTSDPGQFLPKTF